MHYCSLNLRAFSDANYAWLFGCQLCMMPRYSKIHDKLLYIFGQLTFFLKIKKKKKQPTFKKSSTEAEYQAISSTCSKVVWLQQQLKKFGYSKSNIILLYFVKMKSQSKLQAIMSYMNEQNTSKLIAILFGKNWNTA